MPLNSKMWVYAIKGSFTPEQYQELNEGLAAFTEEWAAHGTSLDAQFRIVGNKAVILAVNEENQAATGCSIDDSTKFFRAFGEKHGLNFFDRLLLHTVSTETGDMTSYAPAEIKLAVAEGRLNAHTHVLNTWATTLGESGQGTVPMGESWAAKYL